MDYPLALPQIEERIITLRGEQVKYNPKAFTERGLYMIERKIKNNAVRLAL